MKLALKLPRRNPDAPRLSLRDRAIALKASAAKVMRRPAPEEAEAPAPDFLSPPPGFIATLCGGIPHFIPAVTGVQFEGQRLFATVSREYYRLRRALPSRLPEAEWDAADTQIRHDLRLGALQLLAFGPSPEERANPSRHALISYATWLYFERRAVCQELYPHLGDKADRFTIGDYGMTAFDYHRDALHGPASARALDVLALAGCDWQDGRAPIDDEIDGRYIPDPAAATDTADGSVLAAIREGRRLMARHHALSEACRPYNDDHPAWEPEKEAHAALWDHWRGTVVKLQPVTAEGCRALARYAVEFQRYQELETDDDMTAVLDAVAGSAWAPGAEPAGKPETSADPHPALLPALTQAFAWDRDCRPIEDRVVFESPGGRACLLVLQHCWAIAESIVALPAPKTAAGLAAVALALSVRAEGTIGRAYAEDGPERRHAAAIRAMMSVSGAKPLPEWTGFGDEPDANDLWDAMLERHGAGSLPAWALAGATGPNRAAEA
jgi:hypothetical protein